MNSKIVHSCLIPLKPRAQFINDLTKWIDIYLAKPIILEPHNDCRNDYHIMIRQDGNIDRFVGSLVDLLNRWEYYTPLPITNNQFRYHHRLLPEFRITESYNQGHIYYTADFLLA